MNEILTGIVLGLSAGITPGPLLTLVISETLKYGLKEGLKLSFTPIITDSIIILITSFLLLKINNFQNILGIFSIIGGLYIIYLGYQNLKINAAEISTTNIKKAESIKKGIITNLLSPHPYIFWTTVGTPIILKGFEISIFNGLSFALAFSGSMVGVKVLISILVSKYKNFLNGKFYTYIINFLGVLLIVFALFLIKEGITKI